MKGPKKIAMWFKVSNQVVDLKSKDTPTVADNPQNKYFWQKIFSEKGENQEDLATSGISSFGNIWNHSSFLTLMKLISVLDVHSLVTAVYSPCSNEEE